MDHTGFRAHEHSTLEEKSLSSFFTQLGCQVIRLESGLWHSIGFRIYQPVIMKGPSKPSDLEFKTLWEGGSLFLRYPTTIAHCGISSYIYLVDDKNYDLDSLHGNQRKETRRSLRHCHVERVEISYLIKHGMDLVADTYLRQQRYSDPKIINWWKRNLELSAENPLFEGWAAFVGTELAAFRVDYTYRGGFYGDVLFNRKELLKYQAMNALMFVSTRDVIRRPEIDHVSYGIRATFGDAPSLNRFKESMGYRKIEVEERIDIAPKIKPFFSTGLVCKWGKRFFSKFSDKSDKAKRIYALFEILEEQRMIERSRPQ
jgi:hypothetical protein